MPSPILLSKIQTTELVKKLEIYGRQSLQVRSAIIVELKFKPQGLYVWVDSWPNFTTVALINNVGEKPNHTQFCNIFTSDGEKLKEMLETLDFTGETVMFTAYPVKFEHILQSFADNRSQHMSGTPFTFELLALNKEKSKPRKIPEDVTVSTLTLDHAKLVHTNWEFGNPKNQESEVNFIRLLIASYPTVCFFNADGRAIAYAIGQMYGGIGMLYVEPEFRNRGYGKTVMHLMSEKYSNLGYPPYVSVETGNEVSNKIHKDLGFEPTGCFINWYIMKCK